MLFATTTTTKFETDRRMPRGLRLGDIVQATGDIHDTDEASAPLVAAKGGLGYVVSGPLDAEGSVMVFFERTGLTTVCGEGDVLFLGDARTGREFRGDD